jgi:hypothetical protein
MGSRNANPKHQPYRKSGRVKLQPERRELSQVLDTYDVRCQTSSQMNEDTASLLERRAQQLLHLEREGTGYLLPPIRVGVNPPQPSQS